MLRIRSILADVPRLRQTSTATFAALLLTACGSAAAPRAATGSVSPPVAGSPSTTVPAVVPPAAGPTCPGAGDRALTRTLGHAEVTGFVRGSGRRVVVLSHQSRGTPCDLAALGQALAAAGYRVVAWDAGVWTDQETLSRLVADERRRGASWIALVGASAGGATSIGAAAVITPQVDAVVALSPSGQSELFGDVVPSAGRYPGPLMVVTGELDSAFADLVPQIADAHRGAEDISLLPGVADHGKSLVVTADQPVLGDVVRFLSR
jgi:hypothetical protein